MTTAATQRELEKKYGVIPCPYWVDLCSFSITIDDEIPPVGTEIIFKCANSKIVCGAGITREGGLMRFSAAYANDPWETRKTGKITGLAFNEAITLWSPSGKQYDYHPVGVYRGGWNRIFISELDTI